MHGKRFDFLGSDNLSFIDVFDGTRLVGRKDSMFARNYGGRDTHSYSHALVRLGNFEGTDPAEEIVFVGMRREIGSWTLSMMDDLNSGLSWFRSFHFHVNPEDDDDGAFAIQQLLAVDFEGDGVDEIFTDRFVFKDFSEIPPSNSVEIVDNLFQGVDIILWPYHRWQTVAVGNVGILGDTATQSGGEELVGFDTSTNTLRASGLDAGVFTDEVVANVVAPTNFETLAIGNIDRDSPIVRFDGEHELLYSDPQILAALSAPPFYSEVEQNLGNCYTSFGLGTEDGASTSESMGITTGWSIGYEAEYLFGAASVEWEVSFESSFDTVAQSTLSVQEWITYTTGPENSVVFTVAPFDVYYYTVVSSPFAEEIGNRLTINLPRPTQTLLTTAEFFDDHNGDQPDTVDLFEHTVGDPRSYTTRAERNDDCPDGCYQTRLATVGEGNGFTEVVVSASETESVSTSFDFSVNVSASVGAGGFSVGRSAGFHYGFGIEAKTGTNTTFTGRVSNLKELTADNGYSFGLYGHLAPYAGHNVLMVDYWVE